MIKSFVVTLKQFVCIVLAIVLLASLLVLLDKATEVKTDASKPITVTKLAPKKIQSPPRLRETPQDEETAVNLVVAKEVIEEAESAIEAIKPTSPYFCLLKGIDDYDRETFARLIYHECRGEGGEAVAEVVLNRMLNSQFPDTLQEVVYQRNQFEPASFLFTADIKEPEAFDNCERIVEEVLDPQYEPTLPSHYLYFNSIGPNSEDYCWLGGNVFYGYEADKI